MFPEILRSDCIAAEIIGTLIYYLVCGELLILKFKLTRIGVDFQGVRYVIFFVGEEAFLVTDICELFVLGPENRGWYEFAWWLNENILKFIQGHPAEAAPHFYAVITEKVIKQNS